MKKIDEILDDYELHNDDININEENISKEEIERITNLTLKKAGLKSKKHINKRFILPLAAAMTIILSFAAVFAQGGLNNIYKSLFGDNIKYVDEMETVINESYSLNGITFNVSSMLGDENSFYIIFELIKENGESFEKSNYIEFERLSLDFKGSGGYSWEQIKDDDEKDNKATFILIGDTAKKTAGKNLTLKASNFTEYNINDDNDGLNIYEFLAENKECINQSIIKNYNKIPVVNDDNSNDEEVAKEEYGNKVAPDNILPMKYLDISLGDKNNNIKIDNVGFADEKLCIRLALTDKDEQDIGDIYLRNKNDKSDEKYSEYMFSEEKEGIKYEYYMFDIKNMDELKKYNLKYSIVKNINSTAGEWKVSFKADYKNTSNKFRVNKEIEVGGKRYTVESIKLSPISLNIQLRNNILDNIENPVHNLTDIVTVIMKDGSIVEVGSSGTSTNALNATMNFIFKQPIDLTLVDKVVIENVEININK